MATKQQVFSVLAVASAPLSRAELERQLGEPARQWATQLLRWMNAGFIEDVGDQHYVLTEKGREETQVEGKRMSKETEALREKIAGCIILKFDDILQAFKDAGGVFLDPDQSLPQQIKSLNEDKDWHDIGYEDGYIEAQQDMLKANFRRIKK